MRQRDKQAPQNAEETVRDVRRATRRHFSAEEKVRNLKARLVGKFRSGPKTDHTRSTEPRLEVADLLLG
jgi:hypothetical protein